MIESTTRHSANGSEGDSNEVVSHSTRTPLSSQLSLGPERIPPTSARKSGEFEVFCSSLADIASEACACRPEATVRSRSSHGKGVLQRGNSEEIGDWSSRCSTNGSGAAVVTEKTSSGDDVESRANTSNVASLLGDRRSLPVSVGHDNGEVFCEPSGAAQQFHHYPHRQRRHSEREGAGTTGELPLGGDPLQDCNSHLHAANRRRVTASSPLSKHCPSPKASFEAMLATTTSSIRSGKNGAAKKNTGLSKGRKNTKGVLAHHMAGTYPMQRTTHRFAQLQQKRTDSDGMTSNEPRDAFKKAWMMDSASFSNGSPSSPSSRTSDDDIEGWNGSYSGSGTEGGYAGSASSNDTLSGAGRSCSSDVSAEAIKSRYTNNPCNPDASEHGRKQESTFSTSSDIADFSSGGSEFESVDESIPDAVSDSASNALSSNGSRFFDKREDEFKATKRNHPRRQASIPRNHLSLSQLAMQNSNKVSNQTNLTVKPSACHEINGKAPILALGGDVMAYVLAFLEPPKILEIITAPLSKDWLNAFSHQSELWRVLCLQEPLKARIENEPDSDDESFTGSFSSITGSQHRLTFGKFRLLYTAFVRCMKYLARIKDDASNGRPLSVVDYGVADGMGSHDIGSNQNLRQFLARSRGVSFLTGQNEQADTPHSGSRHHAFATITQSIGVSDNGSATKSKRKHKEEEECMAVKKMRRFASGPSALTQRLLGPPSTGTPGNTELPWSCAIFSIVNWMLAFSDVEGIQTMCLRDLPSLLEDEQQRITAQRAGLTDVVLRAMVTFPDSSPLHTAAFHTIVLLARPLGGREGMLFHTSMVNSSGIFSASSVASRNGKSGIAVMLDSMKRFQQDEVLQAMSCWSLVNIALAPAQKEVLVNLGGIEVTSRAMCAHPHSAEVQFRALFALINLVIPSRDQGDPLRGEVTTEKEMLDESVDQIIHLVLLAMKNFCASEAIVNRACLVLHNVSLTREYHETLLCCPNCYQMLEWCLANYPTDQVLQQSASGTLHRLQLTLNSDEILRTRFATSLQAQQQVSLENVHREAIAAHEQQAQSRTI